MGTDKTIQRAAAICKNCETAHSVRIDEDGVIIPIGTGKGPECSCGEADFRVFTNDADVLDDIEEQTSGEIDAGDD